MKEIALVYVLFGDRMLAESAAVQMVERRLAACANVQADCLSVYHWKGELERSPETPVLFKTTLEQRMALIAAITAVHDYEVPAISSWTVMTTTDYGKWVDAEAAKE